VLNGLPNKLMDVSFFFFISILDVISYTENHLSAISYSPSLKNGFSKLS